jgi:hypothetical protein
MIVSDSLIRKYDIIYHVANVEPIHSCGSVELDVRIVFDDLTNDIENLLNLRFDIVDTLNTPDADCLIPNRIFTMRQCSFASRITRASRRICRIKQDRKSAA